MKKSGSRTFVNSKLVLHLIFKSFGSGEDSKPNENVRPTNSTNGPDSMRVFREGHHSEDKQSSRRVSEESFLRERNMEETVL